MITKGISRRLLGASVILALVFAFASCSDKIDDSNMFTSTNPTMTQYLEQQENFTLFVQILRQVKLSERTNASSLASVLAARGNYTCFAPTDAAVQAYLDSVMNETNFPVANTPDSVAQMIAKSSVIDCGTDKAYTTAEFPVPGAFAYANMNDRLLTVALDSATGSYIINTRSMVTTSDIEVSNGEIHIVSSVISPSNNTLPSIIENTPNMRIMGRLLTETGWADSLYVYRDLSYENEEWAIQGDATERGIAINLPTRRYLGFTAFVETDNVLVEKWGVPAPVLNSDSVITNWDEIVAVLKTRASQYYTNTSDDLESEGNAVNQFVSYHFIKGSIPYNKLVRHYNEYQYKYGDAKNPQTRDLTIDIWSYFETFGSARRILKLTQVADDTEHPIYLNRKSTYNSAFDGNYRVASVDVPGILISESNGNYDNNALNGFVYPIHDVLVYSSDVRTSVLNERMRFDLASILPEMYSNNLRGTGYYYMPNVYFENIINPSNETEITYMCEEISGDDNWGDMEGDEFVFRGLFDFAIKLPPVPVANTYEIRMGLSNNTRRGMAQIYFGTNPSQLTPIGLPVDMRQTTLADFAWVADVEDVATNLENDKNMRNLGYMKGPKSITNCDGKGETTLRSRSSTIRRIITQQPMEPGKTYYLRFKSALEQTDAQFFVDYFELVPRNIYASEDGEDIW